MKEFVIHSIPGSPFGRAVLVALEEKGAQAIALLRWRPATLRTPEHLARHPFGRVPVMDHGDFRLYETQAILRYLDRALPAPALTPADPQAAGRMDQLMNINDWYLFQGVANVIGFQRIVGPRLLGLTPDEAAIAAAMPKAAHGVRRTGAAVGRQDVLRRRFDQPRRCALGPASWIFSARHPSGSRSAQSTRTFERGWTE